MQINIFFEIPKIAVKTIIMKKQSKPSTNDMKPAQLRRQAEEQLARKTGGAFSPETGGDPLRLLHELQVHQIELEMQNAELRQAREEVENLLWKYTDLYDFAPAGYITLDRNGSIIAANLVGAGILGVERSGLIGQHFAHFVPPEFYPALSGFLGRVFTSQTKVGEELELLKGGNYRISVQIEALAAASGQECHLALIDITERKQIEEALHREKEVAETLRRDKEAVEAAARMKSQFLANMSHELRTPMTGILGFLQIALQEEIPPVTREHLETTLGLTRSLLRILNDILDMAKIEAGKITIKEEPFSPRMCISEALDIIAPEAKRKGLDLSLSVAEQVPQTLIGDQARLRQVLINLIGNAVKFTEKGKVAVQVNSGSTTLNGKREFTFVVMDTGIGIPDDKQDLLFRAFSQVDASPSRKYGGTGLGLAISREIVEIMGGTINFKSEAGCGSSFSFTIPLRETRLGDEAPSPLQPESPDITQPAAEGGKGRRILLAEDDPANRKILGMLLRHADYNVDFAEDGQRAVEMWQNGGYDLRLMDVQMPGLAGVEATRAIRERERVLGGHAIIVAMTAHARKEDEERCLAAGMDAYLSKPIDFNKSLELIKKIIKQKPVNNS